MAIRGRSVTVKKVVLSRARTIYNYVKVDELIPELVHPECCFLTDRELEKLHGIHGDSRKARELLLILKKKGSLATRKFIACLMLEPEHSGHQEVAKELMESLPQNEQQRIYALIGKATSALKKVDKSPSYIELQGRLKGSKFEKLDHRLWFYLRESKYDQFYELTTRMRGRSDVPEYQIVGMWFESVAYIHQDMDHEKCVSDLLTPALELCNDPKVVNRNILEGRLHQRISQVQLMLGNKQKMIEHFCKSESLLQFVGRGYDRAKLLLRRAKIMSTAVSPHEKQSVEMMYASALDIISDDDAFAFSCRPSLFTSKAAFHLGISFGSPTVEPSAIIPHDDIVKAREALNAFSQTDIQSVAIRQCEQSLILAKLFHLEGKCDDSLKAFVDVKQRSMENNLGNLVAIAEIHIKHLEAEKSNDVVIDEILDGLPDEMEQPP